MQTEQFEAVLDRVVEILTDNLRDSALYHDQARFEQHVHDTLKLVAHDSGLTVSPSFHPHAFPDITANGFGVEVKYSKKDTWLAVGNSVFEGMRDPHAQRIYLVFGKSGGVPEARWRRYEDCITHVRVSHAPRFVVEMTGERSLLFDHMTVSYEDFSQLTDEEKMQHIRDYSRNRLQEGERLWWLEDYGTHTLPMAVRIYRTLEDHEKRQLRAEATLLCPEVVQSGAMRGKYDQAGLYLMTQHGVFAPQVRDLFSAGSVGARDGSRGHKYIIKALRDIQLEMILAARTLDDRLFVEYWGVSVDPDDRIQEWLKRADTYAKDWKPSDHLFKADG